jgi:hypothetical protein
MLLIVAIIGWVVYVSFFGKPEDIALRDRLLNKGKELGEVVSDIFKSESQKVKSGDYDQIFDKLGEALKNLKQADEKSKKYGDEINRLSDEKNRLEKIVKDNSGSESEMAENNKKLKKLADDIVILTNKMQE